MPVTLRVALGNVSRCARDYSVYLVTLAFATYLLYAFNASGDYLLAMPLTGPQLEVIQRRATSRAPSRSLWCWSLPCSWPMPRASSCGGARGSSGRTRCSGCARRRSRQSSRRRGRSWGSRRLRRGSRSAWRRRRPLARWRRSSLACRGSLSGPSRPRPRLTRARGSLGLRGWRSCSPWLTCCAGRSWSSSSGIECRSGLPLRSVAV